MECGWIVRFHYNEEAAKAKGPECLSEYTDKEVSEIGGLDVIFMQYQEDGSVVHGFERVLFLEEGGYIRI